MSTLADSFLEDLDELSGGSSDEEETPTTSSEPGAASAADAEAEDNDDGDAQMPEVSATSQSRATKRKRPDTEQELAEEKTEDLAESLRSSVKQRGVAAVASLKRSPKYLAHVQKIQLYVDVDDAAASASTAKPQPLEEGSAEYELVVTSNDLMVQIDDEIEAVHRFIAEIYAAKFPELDSLVPNALDYTRVVKTIGNEIDLTLVEELPKLLPSSAVIGISVTGSGTSGKPLEPEVLKTCMEACDELLSLEKDKNMILRFVESRMKYLAPNVSQLVGTRIAAQLIGLAGGVAQLARIPSCNLQVLGQEKKVLSGFSSAAALKHTGVLFFSDLVQSVPPYLRMKACRAVAGKLALMARVDSQPHQNDTEGLVGARFRTELVGKMEKWQEPQKAKTKKALPIPDEKPRRKRGGKRYRKIKERLQMTDVRREMNRQSFATADEEYGDNAMGITSGRLGQEGSGNLRILRKEQKQSSKKLRAANFAASSASKPPLSGLASSLAFTPVQGIELMNPEAAKARVAEANKKYFSAASGFVSVVKKS
ncbi:U4/U6 small nuclear ribonucleoprotein [Phytophthora fragariae]|uniref:U4/U6 small nuclear ribonucleoprotein n=1 Tax=Phytophthora fragariae TaxID=53985 RepID=A0A6A3T246_9STRA|nr:U4/U6 small nuclear ribonucleoprotein [Phytophthora fragariae]KAE8944665.1 U4/U6 small nuclear ribonucleoprotein [Phytophthora fragariae]KAE9018259.1 U4/U6 small nuclear ribonucleoprotein [Phytophthora fragariae]KAE9122883.1 U4/U6 small nuclear ribonucleoprotein [Phytophthora fragariae]KAE9128273.1 U4/U6 small nuclear ribonucleoprotein [Phytophthora fragariae]